MPALNLRIALVILESAHGRIAFQLRADIQGIVNPDRWGFFGGHIEAGETPLQGAVREVEEELTVKIDPARMQPLLEWKRQPGKIHYLFHYLVTHELDSTQLTEGQRWAWLTPEQVRAGDVDGKELVSYHRQMLLGFQASRPQA